MIRRRTIVVAALIAAVAAVVAGAAYAQRWAPMSNETDAQLRKTIVGFELAKASSRPPRMIGRKLTAADKATLQARFLRRIQRFAAGAELREWQGWDYPRALVEDEWDTRELAGCRGKIVYWDFRHRNMDGTLVVRAGVEQRYSVVTWDADARQAIPHEDWVTGVSVNDYTLQESGGGWKVLNSAHWMFYDPATGQLGTGP